MVRIVACPSCGGPVVEKTTQPWGDDAQTLWWGHCAADCRDRWRQDVPQILIPGELEPRDLRVSHDAPGSYRVDAYWPDGDSRAITEKDTGKTALFQSVGEAWAVVRHLVDTHRAPPDQQRPAAPFREVCQ